MIRCRAPFESDAELAVLAAGFLDHSLSKDLWTHDAHWAVSVDLALHHAGFDLSRDLPDAIRRFNVASGLQNTDTSGYHETITRASIAMVERAIAKAGPAVRGFEIANIIMASPLGKSAWLFDFWSKDILMSTQARRMWVVPDLRPLPDRM